MCRRNHLYGWCLICLSLGIFLGYSIESGLVCCMAGAGVLFLGFCALRQK